MNEPTIPKNAAVEVYQVANGFLVKLPFAMARNEYQQIESAMVFQSFAALTAWMAEHFSHRDVGVQRDEPKDEDA